MRKINYIINSEVTISEESDPIDNSVETGSEESKTFENSMTEMGNLLMNSDEKTDNEITKNLGQVGEERQGFQKTLKTNSTLGQRVIRFWFQHWFLLILSPYLFLLALDDYCSS